MFLICWFSYEIVAEDVQSPPTHVLVIRNGHLFTFDLYESKRLLTPPEIRQRLEDIVQQSDQHPGLGLGALTALPRDEWAEVNPNTWFFNLQISMIFRSAIIYVKLMNKIKLIYKL